MVNVLLSDLSKLTNGTIKGCDVEIMGVSKDTRSLKRGDLYIAIKGENFDGHDFIQNAVKNGAVAAVCEKDCGNIGISTLIVENSVTALGQIAAFVRNTINPVTIAVTGSVGKTSTREMVTKIISTSLQTISTVKNENNEIGLPMTIIRSVFDTKALVVEIGMRGFNEISYLSKLTNPNIGIITNIGSSHIERLGSIDNILKAKLEIIDGLKPDGILILNGDDENLWKVRDKLPCKVIYFGILNKKADAIILPLTNDGMYQKFRIKYLGVNNTYCINQPGIHNLYNCAAGILCGYILEISPQKIQVGLDTVISNERRLKIFSIKNVTILDDTYNASPESIRAALSVLKSTPAKRRGVVLADVLEIGDFAPTLLKKTGKLIKNADVDYIITYGDNSKYLIEGAISVGFPSKDAYHFTDKQNALKKLVEIYREYDTILFKGSNSMLVDKLLSEFLLKI